MVILKSWYLVATKPGNSFIFVVFMVVFGD